MPRLLDCCNDTIAAAAVVPDGYPDITENPTWKTVQKNSEATLTCSAAGDPVPTISWLKNFVPLNMSDSRISVLSSGITLFYVEKDLL